MDDNIFDAAADYSFLPGLKMGALRIILAPAAGFGLTKTQYPGPYYPHVAHQFFPWLRVGGAAGVATPLFSRTTLGAYAHGHALYYLGDTFFVTASGKKERWKFTYAPVTELSVAATDRWTLLGRAGWEFGDFYDDIFRTPEELISSRPYFELGAAFAF